ncbi:MAG: hypothetical protein WHV26_09870 [Spirochaetota bacterium]
MNPHITTIQFDATTFSIDNRIVQLLQAKAQYHELSPSNVNNTFLNHSFIHGGDSYGISQPHQTILSTSQLHLLSLARKLAQPQAFYFKVETHDQNPFQTNIFDEYPVYPFLLTLGQQFERWCHAHQLVSEQYYAHLAGMWLLQRCVERLAQILALDKYCTVYPGSSQELPIEANRQLYMLFNTQAHGSGITCNEQYMFWPLHTVAGVILPHAGISPCLRCSLQHCQFRNILT